MTYILLLLSVSDRELVLAWGVVDTSCYSITAYLGSSFSLFHIFFTQELRRTWEKRSRIPWGMPSPEFDLKNSLLLLDSDQDISDDTEIVEEGTDVSISDIYSTDGSEIFATEGVSPIDMSGPKTSLLTTGSVDAENDHSDKPKKYVMRPPKRISAYELHQKISDGFVFDREVRNALFLSFTCNILLPMLVLSSTRLFHLPENHVLR